MKKLMCIVIFILVGCASLSFASGDTWTSHNSRDLEPLKGTVWMFTYTVGGSTYSDRITFSNDITTSSDGAVMLKCFDQDGLEGGVFYGSLPGGGIGYGVIKISYILIYFYNFTINGDRAYGTCLLKEKSTGIYSSYYGLFGIRISGPSQPLCRVDNLSGCTVQTECDALGAEYWWYDGSCRAGSLEVDYSGQISQAPVRLGDDANDGSITDGDGLSIIVDIPTGGRTYALLVFPNDLGYYFIDSGSVITTQLVSLDNAENGEQFVTNDLCNILQEIPELEGNWVVAILTVPSAAPEFHDLYDIIHYLEDGGLYYFGSYSVNVHCQAN